MNAKSGGLQVEGLIVELTNVFHDAEHARWLVVRAGFPRDSLPPFQNAQLFWNSVFEEWEKGNTLDLSALVDEAANRYPRNEVFRGYRAKAAPPQHGEPGEQHKPGGSSTTVPAPMAAERAANVEPSPRVVGESRVIHYHGPIREQVVVQGDATFASPMQTHRKGHWWLLGLVVGLTALAISIRFLLPHLFVLSSKSETPESISNPSNSQTLDSGSAGESESIAASAKLAGKAGQWVYDDYIAVRTPNTISGRLISDEPYVIKTEFENKLSNELFITNIETTLMNDEAAKARGLSNAVIYRLSDISVHRIDPNGRITIDIQGNALLPKQMKISISHSHADRPSTFEIDLGGKSIALPTPPPLSWDLIYQGMDSNEAIERAIKRASKWSDKPYLFRVMFGDMQTRFDPRSRLKYPVVASWSVTMQAADKSDLYDVFVREDDIDVSTSDRQTEFRPIPFPKLSHRDAIATAFENDWVSADYEYVIILAGGKLEDGWTCAWLLPYIGPDSTQVVVDAISGARLSFTLERHGSTLYDDLPVFKVVDEPEALIQGNVSIR